VRRHPAVSRRWSMSPRPTRTPGNAPARPTGGNHAKMWDRPPNRDGTSSATCRQTPTLVPIKPLPIRQTRIRMRRPPAGCL